MSYLVAFLRFWYRFIVGDDWTVAALVVCGLAATFWITHAGVNAWWLMPPAALGTLALGVWRAN